MEKVIEDSGGKYEEILGAIADGIVIVKSTGKVLYTNNGLLKILKFEKPRESVIGENFLEFISPEFRKSALRDLKLALENVEKFPAEYKAIREDGKEIWIEAIGNRVVYNGEIGIFITIRDISRSKEIENSLRESEEKFRTVTDKALAGVYILQDGKIVYANPAMAEIFGYRFEEITGKISPLDLVYPDDKEFIRKKIREGLEGRREESRCTFQGLRKNGKVINCETLVRRVDYRGKPAIIGTLIDITKRREAEKEARENSEKLRRVLEETILALSSTIEVRDPYTAGHQKKVTILARAIAKELKLNPDKSEGLKLSAMTHDIGKIAVPSEILNKPAKLTELEFNIIKMHPVVGYNILKKVEFPWPVAEIVLQHHERLDGSGYPEGLKNGKILFEARILAIADVVEAMNSYRPYRPALGIDKALEEIKEKKGKLYDPEIVEACIKVFEKGFEFKFK